MPTIDSILSVQGLAPNPGGAQEATLLVAVVLEEGPLGWGVCPLGGAAPGYPQPLTGDTARALLEELAMPALSKRSWSGFRQAATTLAGLRQKAVITREVPRDGHVSRRDVIAGRLSAARQPRLEHVEVERPLHPALRLAVEQALLAAEAAWRGQSQAAVLASAFDRALAPAPPALQLAIRGGQALQVLTEVKALAYMTKSAEPQRALGRSGEKLQAFVRQLAAQTRVSKTPILTLQVDVRGALGQLFDNNLGQILGALYGLEQAAKPLLVRIVDPLPPTAGMEQLAELRELIRFRRMAMELVARAELNSAVDVRTIVEAEAVDMVWLELERLGSLAEVMVAAQIAQSAETDVIVGAGPPELLAQVAWAAGPALVAAPDDQTGLAALVNEMRRLSVGGSFLNSIG